MALRGALADLERIEGTGRAGEGALGARGAAVGAAAGAAAAAERAVGERGAGAEAWPAAVLAGAGSAAVLAAGAWAGARIAGRALPAWSALDWVAEHALWGAGAGLAVALLLRGCARFDPLLRSASLRRAAGARLAIVWVVLGLLCMVALGGATLRDAVPLAAGALGSAAVALAAARAWLRPLLCGRGLPRVDPVRAALVASLLTLPLADGLGSAPDAPASLASAWQVILGG